MAKKAFGKTEAFTAINLLIDELAKDVELQVLAFKSRCADVAHGQGIQHTISTRVSYDVNGREERTIDVSPSAFRDLASFGTEITNNLDQIQRLQRFKLRLANDWDFTHGDDTLQKKLWGK